MFIMYIGQKPGEISIFRTFGKYLRFNFHLCLTVNSLYEFWPCSWSHCEIIRWLLILTWMCMKRSDPYLYYDIDWTYLGAHFPNTQRDGDNTIGKPCYEKGLVKRESISLMQEFPRFDYRVINIWKNAISAYVQTSQHSPSIFIGFRQDTGGQLRMSHRVSCPSQ